MNSSRLKSFRSLGSLRRTFCKVYRKQLFTHHSYDVLEETSISMLQRTSCNCCVGHISEGEKDIQLSVSLIHRALCRAQNVVVYISTSMNYIDCFLLIFIPRRLSITLGWSDIVYQNIHSWLGYEAAEICDFKAISHVQYENVLALKSKTVFSIFF